MNLSDALDIHGEELDAVTHGGINILKAAITIFKHMTKEYWNHQGLFTCIKYLIIYLKNFYHKIIDKCNVWLFLLLPRKHFIHVFMLPK